MGVRSLVWEDPLEEAMATHSNILAWRIPWVEEPGRLPSMGSQKSQTWLSNKTTTKWVILGTTNILSKAKTKLKVSAPLSLSQTAPSSSSVLRLTEGLFSTPPGARPCTSLSASPSFSANSYWRLEFLRKVLNRILQGNTSQKCYRSTWPSARTQTFYQLVTHAVTENPFLSEDLTFDWYAPLTSAETSEL